MCALLMAGWAISKDVVRQDLFSTPAVLLFASGGRVDAGIELGLERLLLTLAAAVLAAGAAAAVDGLARRHRASVSQPAQ